MLFHRKFALDIQIESTVKRYESSLAGGATLKVDFSVEKTIGGIGESADITIYGLNLEDIRYICTAISLRGSTPPPRNYISLSAGHGDDYGLIFKGGIFKIEPDVDSPDMSVKLHCLSNFFDNRSGVFQYSAKSAMYSVVAGKIASFFGIPVDNRSLISLSSIIKPVSFNCTGLQAVDQLRACQYGKVDIYISGGILVLADSDLVTGVPLLLSGGSGLVGTPRPTPMGAEIRSILRPALQAGGFVHVESKKLMMTSGLYKIINLRHVGSSRGDEFYSEISGLKVS